MLSGLNYYDNSISQDSDLKFFAFYGWVGVICTFYLPCVETLHQSGQKPFGIAPMGESPDEIVVVSLT